MADAADWWLRPRVVFSVLAVIVVIAALTTPRAEVGSAEPRLTSFSYAENGARGLHDLAARLGWQVERRLEPFRGPIDSAATYAVLYPPIDLTAGEVGVLLAAVRAGAGLIVVPVSGTPIADSLGLRQSARSMAPVMTTGSPVTRDSDDDRDSTPPGSRDPGAIDAGLYDYELFHVLEATRPLPSDTVVMLHGHRLSDAQRRPVVLGRTLDRGRVVALADPRILLNDTVRDSGLAELPIRMIEWASGGTGGPLVFAEYHHGFGRHASMTRALAQGFVHTPIGRALGVLGIAGLLLLLALGMRPMPVRARARVERRSPLEHVTALARAYEQVGATRTAVRHLIRGMRRRRTVGRRGVGDAEMLRALASRHPAIAPDVERVIAASDHPVAPTELLAVGRAIATIERTIYQ